MDTEVQRQEKGLGKVSGGLDSLAAAASRGVENIGIEEELDFKDERTEKSGELHGQKGKVRKAYTITKQRERWTDGEHDRFLQALKRYGRAWRKIEEHIGTKTAVQIRSHAQKFFSKLQREQSQSGAVGEESSKADISIPPPRPKRKPNHPYPRKYNASSENEHSGDGETEKHTPSLPTQPSSTPSYLTPHSFRPANTKGTPDMSLSQILESAAAAAAFAWSQVVANAAPKVQQQLQAHVAAHQSSQTMQPLFSMQPQQESIAAQAMTFQQQPEQLHRPVAKNMHSGSQNLGSQNLSNQFVPSSQGKSIYSSASLGTLRNISPRQESPEARGITLGNERDSASSKEHSQEGGRPVSRPGANSSFQGVNQLRSGQNANPLEMRLGKSALNLMARSKLQTLLKLPAYQPPSQHLNRAPYRAFSAGARDFAGPAPSQGHSHKPEEASGLPKARPAGDEKAHSPTGRSNISQLAQYYQQAAAEEQQAAENGENGSSAGGSGDLGSSAREGKGSDKGSNNNDTNANNASGSEDGQGIGSGSDRTATAERLARYSKGSDDGSNSPPGMPQRSPNAENNDKAAANIAATMLFNMGGVMEPPCMPTPPPSWNAQRGSTPQFPSELPNTQALPRVLSAQQLAAYQQQALQAWAVTAQQSLPNFQLLQGLALAAQAQTSSGVKNEPSIALTPGAVSPQLEPKSSDVPSMDTYNGSNPSFSIPGLNATEPDGKKRSQLSGSGYQKGEEQSGFKPYSKKHGMPISSLPPSKRFAATTNIDRPLAVKPQGFQGLYTPFGSFNAQGNKMFPAAK